MARLEEFLKEKDICKSTLNMKQIQKAVYTAKNKGEDLGYAFGEYKKGMFRSSELYALGAICLGIQTHSYEMQKWLITKIIKAL